MRIHRATGFWVCLIVLCSALTGPIDSFHWYQRVIAAVIDPVQRSPEVAADAKVVGANVAAANVPAGAAGARAQGASAPAQGPRLTLETLWQRSQQVTPNPQEALLLLPKTPSSPVELDIIERSAPNHQAVSVLRLDPYDGRVLGFEPYAASSLANKVMAWGIAIHAGQAGVPAQMALLAGVLGIIVLGYTGLSSYVRRRLGAWRDRARARPLAVGA
jgi:vanillate O-demethylase ferredoxin subunit